MLLEKKDFCSALMKMSRPVRQYAWTLQAACEGADFLPAFPGSSNTKTSEFLTVHIVGGIT